VTAYNHDGLSFLISSFQSASRASMRASNRIVLDDSRESRFDPTIADHKRSIIMSVIAFSFNLPSFYQQIATLVGCRDGFDIRDSSRANSNVILIDALFSRLPITR